MFFDYFMLCRNTMIRNAPSVWVRLQGEAAARCWNASGRPPIAHLVDRRARKGASSRSPRGAPEGHPAQPTPSDCFALERPWHTARSRELDVLNGVVSPFH